jgi:hypothetical protein
MANFVCVSLLIENQFINFDFIKIPKNYYKLKNALLKLINLDKKTKIIIIIIIIII